MLQRAAVVLFAGFLMTGSLCSALADAGQAQTPKPPQMAAPQQPKPASPANKPGMPALKTPADIVGYLVPNDTAFPARLGDVPKADAIPALVDAQQHATAWRADAIDFLLTVLGHETDANRERLFVSLRSCKTEPDNCNEDVIQYLEYLFEGGDNLVLDPLLDAAQINDSGVQETVGSTFGDLATHDARAFVTAVSRRAPEQQRALCHRLTLGDGSGIPSEEAEQIELTLEGLAKEAGPVGATAMLCLTDLKANAK